LVANSVSVDFPLGLIPALNRLSPFKGKDDDAIAKDEKEVKKVSGTNCA
jgi:hypothetical protein